MIWLRWMRTLVVLGGAVQVSHDFFLCYLVMFNSGAHLCWFIRKTASGFRGEILCVSGMHFYGPRLLAKFESLWTIFRKMIFFFFGIFRAVPIAYGSSQARGQIGATAAGLHHSHSNAGSEPVCSLHHGS